MIRNAHPEKKAYLIILEWKLQLQDGREEEKEESKYENNITEMVTSS